MNPTNTLRRHLIRGASGSLIFKITNIALSLLVAVTLARVMGVKNYGVYAFCLSIVQILTVPSMLGGQQFLVREVAAYKIKNEFSFLKGVLHFFQQATLLASIFLALIGTGIGYWAYQGSSMLVPLLISMSLVPLFTAIQIHGATLRGLRHVLLSQAALTIRPALVLVFVGIMIWTLTSSMDAEFALSAQLGTNIILITFTYVLLRKILPIQAKKTKSKYEISKWMNSMVPFIFADGMRVLNSESSVFLLGILQGPEDVGLFRVAQRGAMLIPFGLQAVNMAIAPTVSELATKGETARLQRLISKSIIAVMAYALPVALCLILGGQWLIPLVFGVDFAPAYIPLVILCLGQLFRVAIGSVDVILNMSGLERYTAKGVAAAGITSVILNFSLIPFYGATGAAIATSCSMVIWNILLFVWLYKYTGIVSTVRRIKN